MSRLDWKHGRFNSISETKEINGALFGHQHNYGDSVDYYRFLRNDSRVHDIYDEGFGEGRVFTAPFPLPVIHVTQLEGRNDNDVRGFYYNDEISVVCSFDQITRAGLTKIDLEHQTYLKDRLVYSDRVFRVTNIAVLGQIQRTDIVVSLDATQVKPSELVNDQQFAQWAQASG